MSVEVINFGVSGFGTIQEWQMLEHYVGDYAPDLVLLAFLPGNDVRNNSRQLESDHRRPFAELNDGKLQLRVRPTRVSPMLMKQASTARSLHRRRLMPGEKHGRSGIESWKRCRQNPERWADRP